MKRNTAIKKAIKCLAQAEKAAKDDPNSGTSGQLVSVADGWLVLARDLEHSS